MAARPTIFLTASSTAPATWALFDAPHLLFLARLSAYISTHLSPPVSHTSAAWAVQQQPCSQKGAPTPPFSGFALHCSSVCHLHSASSCLAQDADWPSELNPGLVLARGRLCQFFHSEPFSNVSCNRCLLREKVQSLRPAAQPNATLLTRCLAQTPLVRSSFSVDAYAHLRPYQTLSLLHSRHRLCIRFHLAPRTDQHIVGTRTLAALPGPLVQRRARRTRPGLRSLVTALV